MADLPSSSNEEDESNVFLIEDDLEELLVVNHLHSRLINALDRMLILSAVLILALLTSAAFFQVLARIDHTSLQMVAKLDDSGALSSWPVDIAVCNGLCRKSAPKMLKKGFEIDIDSCRNEEAIEIVSLDNPNNVAQEWANRLNMTASPDILTPLDKNEMCSAQVVSHTDPRDILTAVDLMGQVDESDMILSAKVCEADPATLECFMDRPPALCTSNCDFRIDRGLAYPACHSISTNCKAGFLNYYFAAVISHFKS